MNGEHVVLPLSLKESISKIIEKEDFTKYSVSKNIVSADGGSYMGDLYEVSIKGNTEIGCKEINLFIKNLMDHHDKFTFVSVKDMYLREKYAYTELSEMFCELQNQAQIPERERFKFVKFYDTDNPEAVIMDNLVKKDFRVFNRMELVSLNYAEKVIQEIAKFHAMSFVIQKQRPDYYKNVIKSTKILFRLNEDYGNFIRHSHATAADVLKTEDSKKRLREFTKVAMDKLDYYYYKGPEAKQMVLCHGEYRVSNILLSQEKNGKVSQIIPIDYQTLYFGNPMEDFTFFIFGATDAKFRKQHLNYLKDLYHRTLKGFLSRFNMDVEDVYSRREFEEDYKDRLDYGLIMNLHLLPFILAPRDDAPDLKNEELAAMHIAKHDIYIERVNDLVNDFINWGYL